MARVEGGAVIIDTDWPGLKNQIDNRNINFKYEEDATAYEIFAIDGQYFYKTVIYKSGQAPENQATYDTWRSDFETNYKDRVTDFNSTQPFYLSNVDGYSVVLKDGAAPTSNDGYGVAIIGYDGSNYRMLKSDSSGRPVLVGAGTAGTPAGGVITIQGDPSGTALPISGTISISGTVAATQSGTWTVQPGNTANTTPWLTTINQGGNSATVTASNALKVDGSAVTQPVSGTVTANAGTGNFNNASISSTGSAVPASATYIGFSDGTNLQAPRVFDVDTGGGTQYVQGVNLRLSSGGGSVEFGTASNPIRIDPTGSTTQPVSGTVTANAGTGNFTVVQATASNLRAQLASESATGSAINATAVQVGGSDGTNLRSLFVDTSGRLIVIGAAANGVAVAGNPVLIAGSDGTNARSLRTATDGTVRVDPTGTTTQPVSAVGNFNNASIGSNNAAIQSSSTQIGGSDGTNLQVIRVFDLDTGGGTQYIMGVGLRKAASGGSVELGTSSDPIRTDPTGTTTQPVSGVGNFTVIQSTASNLRAQTSSESNTGSTVPTQASMVGGTDGTNLRAISVDSSGRQVVVGAAADGEAVVGNPVLIAGQDGTNIQSVLTDTSGRIVIASAASAATNGFSNGEIVLASTTTTAIRSTIYTEPTSGAQRSMASSNANDTSAGTGARTVKITYYTLSAGTVAGPFTETVTLNGTSNVNTVATNICYIEKMEVITVGSGGVNAGTITLFGSTGGGGGTVWTIATGTNKTFGCHHYIPSSKTCSVTTFNGGIKGADTSGFILRAKDPTNANAAEIQINDLLRAPSSGNTPVRTYTAPIKIIGPSRITAFAVPDSSSSRTYYASFDFYEE